MDLSTLQEAQAAAKSWIDSGAPAGEALMDRVRLLFASGGGVLN